MVHKTRQYDSWTDVTQPAEMCIRWMRIHKIKSMQVRMQICRMDSVQTNKFTYSLLLATDIGFVYLVLMGIMGNTMAVT